MIIELTSWLWCILQVTVIATVALIVAWSLRGRYPQVASAWLAGAAVAALLLQTIVWIPKSHWSFVDHLRAAQDETAAQRVPQPVRANGSEAAPLSSPALAPIASDPRATDPLPSVPTDEQYRIRAAISHLLGRIQRVDDQVREYQNSGSPETHYLVSVQWMLVGTAACLSLLWLGGWWWLRSTIRGSRPIDDLSLLKRLKRHAVNMQIKHLPTLRETSRVSVGATVGYRRQVLLLNSSCRQWSENELDAVLLHELAHVKRNDYLWVILSSWIKVLFFYHPLMHLLVRRWRMEQELAADQMAAAAMANARVYGRALASLALRVQGAARMPGPALTAEQVCVVRRIKMLSQGRLQPRAGLWRWAPLLTAMTVLALLPLSGLRGVPPNVKDDRTSAVPTAPAPGKEKVEAKLTSARTVDAKADAKADSKADVPAQTEGKSATPPQSQSELLQLSITGRLKWQPSKLLSDDVSPSLRYLQDLVAFALFEQFPGQAELQCPANVTLIWNDQQREHGRFTFGAQCNESHGIDASLVGRMVTNPLLGSFYTTHHTKVIADRTAQGLQVKGSAASTQPSSVEPGLWIVREGKHFYYGTEAEVAAKLQHRDAASSPLVGVPAEYQQAYDAAGAALVFSDCEQWSQRVHTFFDGTSKAPQVEMIYPFLDGLKSLGVFITSERGAACDVRIGYNSAPTAQQVAASIAGLLRLAKASGAGPGPGPLPLASLKLLLDKVRVQAEGNEVRIRVADAEFAQQFCQDVLPEKLRGWTDILAMVSPGPTSNEVMFECNHPFASAGFLAQSLQAAPYRGKRVRLSADLACTPADRQRSGLIVWSSDAQSLTTGNAVSRASIAKVIDPSEALEFLRLNQRDGNIERKRESVEFDVPPDSDVLSVAVFAAAAKLQVSHIQLDVIGPARFDRPAVGLAGLPRNLLQIPNRAPREDFRGIGQ